MIDSSVLDDTSWVFNMLVICFMSDALAYSRTRGGFDRER